MLFQHAYGIRFNHIKIRFFAFSGYTLCMYTSSALVLTKRRIHPPYVRRLGRSLRFALHRERSTLRRLSKSTARPAAAVFGIRYSRGRGALARFDTRQLLLRAATSSSLLSSVLRPPSTFFPPSSGGFHESGKQSALISLFARCSSLPSTSVRLQSIHRIHYIDIRSFIEFPRCQIWRQ